jgi:rod shape-determining protein MreC
MLKRPHYIALGLVVLSALVILNLPDRAASRLKLGLGGLFLPLFGLASSTHQLANQAADALVPRSELARQNESLRREKELWRVQSIQAEELARENARLRQLWGWQQQQRWKLKLANVVLREPANWWRTVEIDLGARNGVSNNLPVLAHDGSLVGRISSVSLTHAQVVLLGDPGLKVAARVENETRDTGIIGASGPLDSDLVEMGYLSRNANLKPGQNVVTSGNGGIFPRGIPVGKIVDAHSVDFGLRTEARVKLAADLNALEEVWVLFP